MGIFTASMFMLVLWCLTGVTFFFAFIFFFSRNNNKPVSMVMFGIPASMFCFFLLLSVILYVGQNLNNRRAEKHYIGNYRLTAFKQDTICILTLKEDNKYEVTEAEHPELTIESGTWEYIDYGDGSVVQLNTPRGEAQLGGSGLGGNYSYERNQTSPDLTDSTNH